MWNRVLCRADVGYSKPPHSSWDRCPWRLNSSSGQPERSCLIAEPLHVALENGAIRALVPISNKSQFAALSEETVEKLDVIFYGDIDRAVLKAIEL